MRRGARGEGRNPKPEGRKKAEIRSPNGPRHPVSVFGFRNSAFFRPSTFGLRPSTALGPGSLSSGGRPSNMHSE